MAFIIRFIPENMVPPIPLEPDTRLGEIVIGEYHERFEAATSFWQAEDYQHHWKQAVERIVNGEEKSCLITTMDNPDYANFIFWWPLYRVGNTVFIQNQILFLEDETTAFNPLDPYKSVRNRETLTEEGLLISEWEVSVLDLEQFIAM